MSSPCYVVPLAGAPRPGGAEVLLAFEPGKRPRRGVQPLPGGGERAFPRGREFNVTMLLPASTQGGGGSVS